MMNVQTCIEAWTSRHPHRFKIGRCTAGSVSFSCASPHAEGTNVVTLGRKLPDDVPVVLTIWVADDASHAFAVHTHEDNYHSPDESPLGESNAGTEITPVALLDEAVSVFCATHGFGKDQLYAEAAPINPAIKITGSEAIVSGN